MGESARKQLAGLPAAKWFKVDAGHGVGKTFGCAALVNWFFDAFTPAIIMTTAPTGDQVKLLLWKDIKAQRGRVPGLPGEVLALEMRKGPDHFAIGRSVDDSSGKGTERFQGQHGKHLLFILDEAEGVPDFVFDAVKAMMTGGLVVICIMIANPKTRTSRYYRTGMQAGVAKYRLSVLDHPNVVKGSNVVPGATNRDWVETMIADECEVTLEHDDDAFTFQVAWPCRIPAEEGEGWVGEHPPGTIFVPSSVFLFRVMGIAPKSAAGDTLISPGRYEAATKRAPSGDRPTHAWLGVDCARYGDDLGTVYAQHAGKVWREAQIAHGDTDKYWSTAKDLARKLKVLGVLRLSIRVDGTGGYGGGIVDKLKGDIDLRSWFPDGLVVVEVNFGENAHDREAYANRVTELYGVANEALKSLSLHRPPVELEADLTARRYKWVAATVNDHLGALVQRDVKQLEPKDRFKKDHGRSPDDGDGLVLAIAPDRIFTSKSTDWSGWS